MLRAMPRTNQPTPPPADCSSPPLPAAPWARAESGKVVLHLPNHTYRLLTFDQAASLCESLGEALAEVARPRPAEGALDRVVN